MAAITNRGNYPWLRKLGVEHVEPLTSEEAEQLAVKFRKIGFTRVEVRETVLIGDRPGFKVVLYTVRGMQSVPSEKAAQKTLRHYRKSGKGASQVK